MKEFKVYFAIGDKKLMKKVEAMNESHAKLIVINSIQFMAVSSVNQFEHAHEKIADKDIEFLDKLEKVIDKMADLERKIKK